MGAAILHETGRSNPTLRVVTTLFAVIAFAIAVASCSWREPGLLPGYAIVYGVADYQGSSLDLRYSNSDARAIAALLEADGYEVYLATDDGTVDGRAATVANLEADFAEVAARVAADGGDARFVFYFAGHGYGAGMERYYAFPPAWYDYFADLNPSGSSEPANEYLFLYDTVPLPSGTITAADVEAFMAGGVSNADLADLVASVDALHRVVIIDACHSGGFLGFGSSVDPVPEGYAGIGTGVSLADAAEALSVYARAAALELPGVPEQSATVLSASGRREFSYEYAPAVGIPHGIFTHYLLEATRHGDRNYDGYVTADEVFAYASAAISANENPTLGGEMKFLPRVSGGAVDVVVVKTRR